MEYGFGARLRLQREERGVALADISAKTKIKQSMLESLESEDVSQWPKGLFGRAYLRDYARAIGLDGDAIVSQFLALYPSFAKANPELDEMEAVDKARAAIPPATRLRRALSAFAGSRNPLSAPPRTVRDDVPSSAMLLGPRLQPAIDHANDEPDGFELTPSAQEPVHTPVDLPAFADMCTRLARALDVTDLTAILADASRLLGASGIIVWQWDPAAYALKATLAHGYAPELLARIPTVGRQDANAVATAFKLGDTCVVEADNGDVEALVIPAMGISGCVCVLAVEFRHATPAREPVCALATILGAQLAMLLPDPSVADVAAPARAIAI